MHGKRFWDLFDWLARGDFLGTLLGLVFDWKTWLAALFGGGGMTFVWAAIVGRDPLDVWVLALFTTACLVIIIAAIAAIVGRLQTYRPSTAMGGPNTASDIMRDYQEGKWEPLYPPNKTPAPENEFIPLEKATSEAYGIARGTIFGEAAERLSTNGALIWFAYYFLTVAKVPFHGNVRLSPKREQTTLKGFDLANEGDRIIAKEINGKLIWENLCLSRENFDRALARLNSSIAGTDD